MFKYFTFILFIVLAFAFYYIPVPDVESSQLFLTISTFLLAIFAGFSISRQGKRYSDIRTQIANFDGQMSSIYRQAGHVDKETQDAVKAIIAKHYKKLLKEGQWDYYIENKSTTLTSIHELCQKQTRGKGLKTLEHLGLQRILTSLENAQVARKRMVALHQERIPFFQWTIIYFLVGIMLATVAMIDSHFFILGSIMKGVFASAVVSVLILLHNFNGLNLFERSVGMRSAQDVLDIFAGKK